MTLAAANRVDQAVAQLKSDILANRLPPGFQATEPEFALRLGMSRTPVREALLRLAHDGLIEMIPRRGARVLPVRARDMADIYEILTALEPQAAACLAARPIGERGLDRLGDLQDRMESALAADDLDAWAAADDAFHRALLVQHGNLRMLSISETLMDQAHRARMITLRLRDRPDQSTRDHRAILTALRNGDAPRARALFHDHRTRAAQELLRLLDTYRLPQL